MEINRKQIKNIADLNSIDAMFPIISESTNLSEMIIVLKTAKIDTIKIVNPNAENNSFK